MSQETLLTEAEKQALVEDEAVVEVPIEPVEESPIEPVVEEEVVVPPVEEETIVAPEPEQIQPQVNEPIEPGFRYPNVALTDTVPAELNNSLLELKGKFDQGDIDVTEYMTERSVIDRQVTAYQIQEAAGHKNYNEWMDAQDVFMADNRQYLESKARYGALNAEVTDIQSDPKSRFMTPMQIITKAHENVIKAFGPPAVAPVIPVVPAPSVAVKPNNPLPTTPTLTNIPASSANEITSNPFASIDSLQGEAKEAAVRKLSPEQYEAYLRS